MTSGDFDKETELQQNLLQRSGVVTRRYPVLEWHDGAGSHRQVIDGRTVAGSSASAVLRVDSPHVSRVHAEFDLRANGLWVRDLGSKNGTFVDGVLVLEARVPDDGRVTLGSTELALRSTAVPTPVDLWPHDSFGELVGRSAVMRELFHHLAKVAPLTDPLFIGGETGTGKEEVARAVHGASPRAKKPFVVFDCGAMTADLLEAELFGHTKGAFTGATHDRMGGVEAADGGTLFLDEIGELPLALQPKLLRLVESKSFRPVGSNESRNVDVRFVSASHRNLAEMVNQGTFREDLYFRLMVFSVRVPPLRDRLEDLDLLIAHFLPAERAGQVSAELLHELRQRVWPGNVRELRNFVNRAVALGVDAALTMDRPASAPSPDWATLPYSEARALAIAEFERTYTERLLAHHKHNVSAAAEAAGMNRTYLHRLMAKHGDEDAES